MKDIFSKTVGEIVAEDYRTAMIFQSFGIDFCCKGNRTLKEVCESRSIEPEILLEDIESVTAKKSGSNESDYRNWPLDRLADHIEEKHHRYVEAAIPPLKQQLEKICRVHGSNHPELHVIAHLFATAAGELTVHMKKEELMLFPLIRKMAKEKGAGSERTHESFRSVDQPIVQMMAEHDTEGERFGRINELTDSYSPPEDACMTYKLTLQMLSDFEKDLHLHIHLENNILFPKAIALEETLRKTE